VFFLIFLVWYSVLYPPLLQLLLADVLSKMFFMIETLVVLLMLLKDLHPSLLLS
jgi:hypothetical protein